MRNLFDDIATSENYENVDDLTIQFLNGKQNEKFAEMKYYLSNPSYDTHYEFRFFGRFLKNLQNQFSDWIENINSNVLDLFTKYDFSDDYRIIEMKNTINFIGELIKFDIFPVNKIFEIMNMYT